MRRPKLLLLAFLASNATAATSFTDAWDVSQGASITSSSPTGYGVVSNMFGDSQVDPFATWEVGHTLFEEGAQAGFVASVEWNTTATILLQGYNLTLVDDFQTGERGISSFILYGRPSEAVPWQLLDTFVPAAHPYSPYGDTFPENFVEFEHSGSFSPVASKFFRAEFTQYVGGLGIRVVELDAITAVPEASSSAMVVFFALFAACSRKRSCKAKNFANEVE